MKVDIDALTSAQELSFLRMLFEIKRVNSFSSDDLTPWTCDICPFGAIGVEKDAIDVFFIWGISTPVKKEF